MPSSLFGRMFPRREWTVWIGHVPAYTGRTYAQAVDLMLEHQDATDRTRVRSVNTRTRVEIDLAKLLQRFAATQKEAGNHTQRKEV